MEENGTKLKVIMQYGAIGLSVLLIGVIMLQTKLTNTTNNNHIQHHTEALIEFSNAITELTGVINNNTRIIERVERALDK